MRILIRIGFLILYCLSDQNVFPNDTLDIKRRYEDALNSLQRMVQQPGHTDFKRSVFLTENTFLEGSMDSNAFETKITELKILTKAWMVANPLNNYHFGDSINFLKNMAIYKLMKDCIKVAAADGKEIYSTIPYVYDFNDFEGNKDWTKMFVTKLLYTYSGNCHSLPYLYKILADEINATCWLALAPNHIYVQNRCKKIGWYNTELTSGDFPIDAWIMASGYLPLKAIQSGIYMDSLGNQESIALCILDLAKGYEHKTSNYYDGFILKCCDLSLKYFPHNVQAILLKAETLKRIYDNEKLQKAGSAKDTYHQMEMLYLKLLDLGYREMPEKMYMQWLQSVVKERDKYSNKKLNEAIQGK